MPFEEGRECERAFHHRASGRERRVRGIHVAEMDLAFVGHRGPTEQRFITVEQNHLRALRRQSKSNAASLQATSKHANVHRQPSYFPGAELCARRCWPVENSGWNV